MNHPSMYVRKAYETYDQGLINLTEFGELVRDIQDYASLWEEHMSLIEPYQWCDLIVCGTTDNLEAIQEKIERVTG